ncbi:MAG: glycosyltransferase family 4 protein [Candidatus Omnitrophica bacterium]|nr:glycosyltransferase family 4 protein [Candidatus Omnitrophota bacterium]
MKILQVVHNHPFSAQAGTELHTQELSLELSRKHEVSIFCRASDPRQKDYKITKKNYGRIAVHSINNSLRDCNSFEMLYENEEIDRRFDDLLGEINPDLVHIQHLVFLSIGMIGKIKKRGIPIVLTLHDYWLVCPKWHLFKNDLKPCEEACNGNYNRECAACLGEMLNIRKNTLKLYMLARRIFPAMMANGARKVYPLFNKGLRNSENAVEKLKKRSLKIKNALSDIDFFFAPSEHIKDSFIRFGIPAEKIKFSKFNLNSSLYNAASQKSRSNKIRFAFIGTLLPAKGLHVLIESFNNIPSRDIELKVYAKLRSYAGYEHYLPYLKKLIKNKNIRLMGDFDHENVADIFKEIDVLIVPSLWQENRPLVIEEAFLSQTPVIASRIGGIPELVKHSVNGLLFDPGDAESLRRIMEHIRKNPILIKRFEFNIARFSNDDKGKTVEGLYENPVIYA